MTTRGGKFAVILLWGGAGLMVLGLVLGYPRLLPYIETMLYTRNIPTAPPFEITSTPESDAVVSVPVTVQTPTETVSAPTPIASPMSDETPAPDNPPLISMLPSSPVAGRSSGSVDRSRLYGMCRTIALLAGTGPLRRWVCRVTRFSMVTIR